MVLVLPLHRVILLGVDQVQDIDQRWPIRVQLSFALGVVVLIVVVIVLLFGIGSRVVFVVQALFPPPPSPIESAVESGRAAVAGREPARRRR